MPKQLAVDCGRRVGELMVAERAVTTTMQGSPFILRMVRPPSSPPSSPVAFVRKTRLGEPGSRNRGKTKCERRVSAFEPLRGVRGEPI
eukprot:759028-Prorocentrum_minimum.AAC.1